MIRTVIFLFFTLLSNFIINVAVIPVSANLSPISMGFLCDFDPDDKQKFAAQLELDPAFDLIVLSWDESGYDILKKFQIVVIAGDFDHLSNLSDFTKYVSGGGNLMVFPNENSIGYEFLLQAFNFIPSAQSLLFTRDAMTLGPTHAMNAIVDDIEWDSAPELTGAHIISEYNPSVIPLVLDGNSGASILFQAAFGSGKVFSFNLAFHKDFNWDFQLWWYTPYLFYKILSYLSDSPSLSYTEWAYSPVPHTREKIVLVLIISGLCLGTVGLYILAKSRSKNPLKFKISTNNTNLIHPIQSQSHLEGQKWERIGLHRQISSFFLNFLTFLIFNLPHIFIVISLYYRYIQPFPMIQGSLSWIGGIFGSIFLIVDFEIGTALKKFFAEYRVQSLTKAVKYAQIYVWWQIWLTLVQGIIFVTLVVTIVPGTYVGYLSYFFICSSLFRFPAGFGAIGLVMDSLQRLDIRVKLNAYLGLILNTIVSWAIIYGFRLYFAHRPQFGEAIGSAIGVYVGSLVAGLLDTVIYIMVFRKLGYSVGALFRIDYDKSQVKEAVTFGTKLTFGNMWRGIAGLVESFLISLFIMSYNSELGYYGLVGNLTTIVGLISIFIGGLMPAISESHGNGKTKLTEYYLMEGIKWTNFILFFFTAVMAACGARFLMLTGGQWAGALKYVQIQLFFGFFWPMAWYADTVFQGTNHAGYNTLVWVIEQGVRTFLLFIFLPRYGLWGIYYSYIPGIIAKDIVSLILIRLKICAFKPYLAHTTFIPAISAIIVYFLLAGLAALIPLGSNWLNGALLLFGLLGGLILYGFLTGLMGGWDKNTLREFEWGISMVNSTRLVFRPLYIATAFGQRISPLRNRFQVDLFESANREAITLTEEKKND